MHPLQRRFDKLLIRMPVAHRDTVHLPLKIVVSKIVHHFPSAVRLFLFKRKVYELSKANTERSGYQGYVLAALIAAPGTHPRDNSRYEIRGALARIAA